MQSAKQLLNAKFSGEESQKSKRHAAHEFQAFAYKIAADFKDIENLRIYLSVLKNCERIIVEKAYSFTIDSRSENKAKIFFWKIKQLRKEFEDYKNQSNFEWDFVKKNTKKVRDVYSEDIYDGARLRKDFVQELILKYSPFRVLMVNVPVVIDGFKRIEYVDQSSKLLKLLSIPPARKRAIDFMDFKPKNKFDLIISDYSWNTIPFDYETAFLSNILGTLNNNGHIVMTIKIAPKNQGWRQKEINGAVYWIFQKFAPLEYFMEQISRLNLKGSILDMSDKTATIELTRLD